MLIAKPCSVFLYLQLSNMVHLLNPLRLCCGCVRVPCLPAVLCVQFCEGNGTIASRPDSYINAIKMV